MNNLKKDNNFIKVEIKHKNIKIIKNNLNNLIYVSNTGASGENKIKNILKIGIFKIKQ